MHNMKRVFFIYRTTNLINNKYYGKHSTHNINDGYLGSGVLLYKAIKKYSKENFSRDILMFFNSENTKRVLSRQRIGKTLPKENYDKHRLKFSEETKIKLSKKMSKPISVNGIEYKSTKETSKKLGIGMSTINYRLKSQNFNNYIYL